MMNTQKRDRDVVDKALDSLMEFFDAVQIVASRTDQEGTVMVSRGRGNWYARVGMSKEFVDDAQNSNLVHQLNDER